MILAMRLSSHGFSVYGGKVKNKNKIIYGLIPKYLPIRVLLFAMGVLKYFGRMNNKEIKEHFNINNVLWREYYEEKKNKINVKSTYFSNIKSEEITSKDCGEVDVEEKESSKEKSQSLHKEKRTSSEEKRDFGEDKTDSGESSKREIEIHNYENNKIKIYIDNQNELSKFLYGKQKDKLSNVYMNGEKLNASHNTCEIIATYNVLTNEGVKTSFPKLIAFFENRGMMLSGYFGTSAGSISKCLKTYGLKTKKILGKSINKKTCNILSKEYNSFIFMAYNNKDNIEDMIHTMAIIKDGDGFRLYNDYENNRQSDDIYSLISGYHKGMSKAIMFMGVKR